MNNLRQAADVFGGFDDIIGGAISHGFASDLFGAGAGYNDDRQIRVFGMHSFDHLHALEAEDVEIAQDEVKAAFGEGSFKVRAPSGLDQLKAVVFFFQGIAHQFAVAGLFST